MPSAKPIPTPEDFLRAARNAVRAERERNADTRRGSVYELVAGPAAMIWAQQARKDKDLFRALYEDTAEGDQLASLVTARYGIERRRDACGTGTATISRPTVAAGEGTLYAGTRILAANGTNAPRAYLTTADLPFGATTTDGTVAIRAELVGAGASAELSAGLVIDDAAWDATLRVDHLQCANGTTYETAPEFLARVRETRRDIRPGHVERIRQTCIDAGAVHVATFAANSGTNDYGVSAVYVGDAGFGHTAALVRDCAIALEEARVVGCDLHVGGISQEALAVDVTVGLWGSVSSFATQTMSSLVRDVVADYFAHPQRAYAYTRDAIGATIRRLSPAIQSAIINAPASDAVVTSGIWPDTLPKYAVRASSVGVTFTG